MEKTNGIELWEIMKDGKHNEVFEVTGCGVSSYIGHRIKVKESADNNNSYKCLIKENSTGDDSSNLAPLYGCLGTARYKKVEEYVKISVSEAIEMLERFKSVYVYSAGELVEFGRYMDFEDVSIQDMSDLLSKNFYKRGK